MNRKFSGTIRFSRKALLMLRLKYGGKSSFVSACRKEARRRAA